MVLSLGRILTCSLVSFCKDSLILDFENRSKVLFSDVSRFTFHRSDGHVYVRRMAGEKFNDHSVIKSVGIIVHMGMYQLYWDVLFFFDKC